jgi:hypothetical protein
MTRKFSSLILANRVGEGGAAATATVTGRSTRWALRWLMIVSWTVGAPQKFVTPSASIRSQISSGSTFRIVTWQPATAVTAHVKHQPLQWNIGCSQRKTESCDRPATSASLSALR